MAPKGNIVEVWEYNLNEAIAEIIGLLDGYPYVAIDTEFPGVVAEPVGPFKDTLEYRYQTLRCNVDILKMIQLGFTFADAEGNLCPTASTWQFNFRFSLDSDTYAQDSINLLTESGIDFERFDRDGIDIERFGELLMSSGVVLNDAIKWISFHSCYDFAYLLKAVTCQNLPEDRDAFLDSVHTFFPNVYDMKYIARETFRGGLNKLAAMYNVERHGQMHQAGSDSLVTQLTYFKLREDMGPYIEDVYNGKLFGIEELPENSGAFSPPRQQTESPVVKEEASVVVNAPAPHVLSNAIVANQTAAVFAGGHEQISDPLGYRQEFVY